MMYRIDIVKTSEEIKSESVSTGYEKDLMSFIKKSKQDALIFIVNSFSYLAYDPYIILRSIDENRGGFEILAKYSDNDGNNYEMRCYQYDPELFKDVDKFPMFTNLGNDIRNIIIPLFTMIDENDLLIKNLKLGKDGNFYYNRNKYCLNDYGTCKFDLENVSVLSNRWSEEDIQNHLNEVIANKLMDN